MLLYRLYEFRSEKKTRLQNYIKLLTLGSFYNKLINFMLNFEKFSENWNYLKDTVLRYLDSFFNSTENVHFNVINISQESNESLPLHTLVEIIIKAKEYTQRKNNEVSINLCNWFHCHFLIKVLNIKQL